MGYQRGRNNGITGLIDLPQAEATTRKFAVKVYSFSDTAAIQALPLSGRSVGLWAKSVAYRVGGTLLVSGEVLANGYPEPDAIKGEEGTLTLTLHTGRTKSIPIRVDQIRIDFSTAKEDAWKVSLSCTITGQPTYSTGWEGTQPVEEGEEGETEPVPQPEAEGQAAGSVETYDGMAKTIDPQAIEDSATRRFVVWPIDDTDAAEVTALGSLLGTLTTPVSDLQVRVSRIERLGSDVIAISISYAHNTSKQEIEFGGTRASIHFNDGLRRVETAVVGVPVAPGDTALAIANAAYATLKSNVEFESIEVRKLSPTKAVQAVQYADVTLRASARTLGTKKWVQAVYVGGHVKVLMAEKVERADGYWYALLVPQLLRVATATIRLRKRSIGYPVWNWNQLNTRNNASFLGFAQGTVSYIGAESPEMDLTATAVSETNWLFEYNSLGHYLEDQVRMGWVRTDADLSGVDPGLVEASVFGWAGAVVLPYADYTAAFLS